MVAVISLILMSTVLMISLPLPMTTTKKNVRKPPMNKTSSNGISLTLIISRDKGPSSLLPLFSELTEMCAAGAADSLPVINPAERSWSRSGTQAQRDTVRADLTNANPLYPFPEWTVIVSRLKCAGEVTKTKTWQRLWICVACLWLC